jgi:hypothetical protein
MADVRRSQLFQVMRAIASTLRLTGIGTHGVCAELSFPARQTLA